MNKFLFAAATVVVSVLASVMLLVFGQESGALSPQMTEDEVTTITKSVVDSIYNPKFATFGDVIRYRNTISDKANEDYTLMEMSSNALQTVVDVLISRGIDVTPSTICREFYDHQEIYEKIPSDAPKSVIDSIVVDTAFVKGYDCDTLKH